MFEYDRVVNLTGRDLTIEGWDGSSVVLPSPYQVYVQSEQRVAGRVCVGGVCVPLLEITERSLEQLPARQEGQLIIVSGLASTMAGRDDVVTVSRQVRKRGKVVAARALARVVARDGSR